MPHSPTHTITIRAKKSLGQNFLIDESALFVISHSIPVEWSHIVEVWPGYGALTEYLIPQRPASLDLVELDADMIHILSDRITHEWHDTPIRLHHQDVLTFTPPSHAYSVIANIPYYITSPILFHFLYPEQDGRTPDAMTILMQKEVGEKILAKKGKKTQHSYLSLAMHLACESIESLATVPSASFDPAPKVDSIVLRFVLRTERDRTLERRLISLWNDAFGQPRKTLLANLKRAGYDSDTITESLKGLNHSALVRAEALSLDDWKYLLWALA